VYENQPKGIIVIISNIYWNTW